MSTPSSRLRPAVLAAPDHRDAAPVPPPAADPAPSAPRTPDELGDRLAERLAAHDVDGLVALYEPSAVLELPDGRVASGHAEIRAFYARMLAGQGAVRRGVQKRPLVQGDLALTTTVLPMTAGPGAAACEVARRQADGTWRWVIDRPQVR